MKKLSFLLLFIATACLAQEEKSTKIGLTTAKELQMPFYIKDTTANAVVLYEHANVYIDELNNFKFRTDYYYRIKLFKKEVFDKATISISLYKEEKVKEIKAVTYNLSEAGEIKKTHVSKAAIFTKEIDKNWKEVTFTFPDIKEGSVIEYVYSVLSPYPQLDDWYFQSDIPKIKSEYDSAILGNYKYNTRLIGFQKLDKDNPSVKNSCVYIPAIGNGACAVSSFGMNDIPAFIEEEHMLSKKNFISRVSFDLVSFTSVKGWVTKYTKTWKDADRSFKELYLDGQTSKKRFFKKKLPQKIIMVSDDLPRAKKVFNFIKNHFSWDKRNWTRGRIRIKKAFENRSGSVAVINLSLYNMLQAAEIESYLVMSSTRNNGLPTKLYPVTSGFNYVLVKAIINGKEYFLDATNKQLPFGMVPLKCLNGEGRVLDFENGSYWDLIVPTGSTSKKIKMQMTLSENGFVGKSFVSRTGYYALGKREEITVLSEDAYLENFEEIYPKIEVENYQNRSLDNLEKSLQEVFELAIEEELEGFATLRIHPFFMGKLAKNPFKMEKRDYPVDFGYPRKNTYLLSLKIPEEYTIKKLPESKGLKLPNGGGSFLFKTSKTKTGLNLYFSYKISKKSFSKEEYFYLKEFYKQLIEAQNSYIELEKK